jgi:hypothetical protein
MCIFSGENAPIFGELCFVVAQVPKLEEERGKNAIL